MNRIERLVDPTTVIPTCSRGFCLALVLGASAGAAALAACDTRECPAPEQVAAPEQPAEVAVDQTVVTQLPAGVVPGVKYIDEHGKEISPVGPDGKWKGVFGQFTDEHGQNFAVLMGPDWKVEPPPAKDKSDGVPIPFLDGVEGNEMEGNGTDGC